MDDSQPDSSMVLSGQKQIGTLRFCHNNLKSLPQEVFELSASVCRIDVSFNKISSISNNIGRLSLLRMLDLSYNRLQSLPDEISLLVNLEELYIENNSLLTLPKSTVKLNKLLILFVFRNNKIFQSDELKTLETHSFIVDDNNFVSLMKLNKKN